MLTAATTFRNTIAPFVLLSLLLLATTLSTAVTAEAASRNATVYVIRHGEKTFGGGCLNIQGQERANHLPMVFNSTEQAAGTNNTFATPTAIFANNYFNIGGNCERCLLTVLPIAQALGIDVDFHHGFPHKFGGNAAAADAIRKVVVSANPPSRQLGNSGKQQAAPEKPVVVLVSWEHVNIQFLIAQLGVPKEEIPIWKDSNYDSVYVLTLDATTAEFVSFEAKAQHYQPRSTTCDPAKYVPPEGYHPPRGGEDQWLSEEA